MENTKRVQCLTCGYEWNCKSTKVYTNCPSCRSPVKINEIGYRIIPKTSDEEMIKKLKEETSK